MLGVGSWELGGWGEMVLMCVVLELAVQFCAEADGVDQEGS